MIPIRRAALAALGAPGRARAQSLLDRPPNLSGAGVGNPGTPYFPLPAPLQQQPAAHAKGGERAHLHRGRGAAVPDHGGAALRHQLGARAQDIHTSTSESGAWNSGQLSPGTTFKRTFDAAGTFPYHCDPHPSMKGSVVVR